MRTAELVADGVRIRDGEQDFVMPWHAITFQVIKQKHPATKDKIYQVGLVARGRLLLFMGDALGYPTATLAEAACKIARDNATKTKETKIIAPQEHKVAASS